MAGKSPLTAASRTGATFIIQTDVTILAEENNLGRWMDSILLRWN